MFRTEKLFTEAISASLWVATPNKRAERPTVNIHKNARLTFIRRREMVTDVKNGHTQRAVAERFGVSVRTVGKWVRRFRDEGEAGLHDRSSRPLSSPTAVSMDEAERALALRQTGLLGEEIASRIGRARSTVSKILRAARISTERTLKRDPNPHRYEHPNPGDLLHIDIKKLGRFKRPGHRVIRRSSSEYKASQTGWEYVHVCVDDHSRFAHVELLDAGEKGDAAAAFLRRAVQVYKDRGIVVRRVMTDNGPGYKSKAFRRAVNKLGLKHIRTKPYTPQTNGKAERFIQTIQREWAYVRPYKNSAERRRALPRWLRRYNYERPHSSLGKLPPSSRIRKASS